MFVTSQSRQSRKFVVTFLAIIALGLSACSAPKRGESELEYKNRLAKYTIAGVLIGGYYGVYHASTAGPIPFDKIVSFSNPNRANFYLAAFYAALGGAAGHALVEQEGELKRILYDLQGILGGTTRIALDDPQINVAHPWSSPDHKATGTVTVVDRYVGSQGYRCQDLVATVTSDGESARVNQSACLLPNGQWELWTRA